MVVLGLLGGFVLRWTKFGRHVFSIGTALGATIGAALIELIRNSLGLLGINAFWQGGFIGGAILPAVLFDRLRNFRPSE